MQPLQTVEQILSLRDTACNLVLTNPFNFVSSLTYSYQVRLNMLDLYFDKLLCEIDTNEGLQNIYKYPNRPYHSGWCKYWDAHKECLVTSIIF